MCMLYYTFLLLMFLIGIGLGNNLCPLFCKFGVNVIVNFESEKPHVLNR